VEQKYFGGKRVKPDCDGAGDFGAALVRCLVGAFMNGAHP